MCCRFIRLTRVYDKNFSRHECLFSSDNGGLIKMQGEKKIGEELIFVVSFFFPFGNCFWKNSFGWFCLVIRCPYKIGIMIIFLKKSLGGWFGGFEKKI